MKRRKLKKIAKFLIKEIDKYNSEPEEELQEVYEVDEPTNYNWTNFNDYDPSVSEKTKKLVVSLYQYRDRLSVTLTESEIYISCSDLTNIKKPKNTNNKMLVSHGNYIEIYIYKDRGFTITYNDFGYTKYMDVKMYDELLSDIKKINDELNRNNFNDIYQSIMKDSGVIREANLDEVFNLEK
jgi:hypothetical protein